MEAPLHVTDSILGAGVRCFNTRVPKPTVWTEDADKLIVEKGKMLYINLPYKIFRDNFKIGPSPWEIIGRNSIYKFSLKNIQGKFQNGPVSLNQAAGPPNGQLRQKKLPGTSSREFRMLAVILVSAIDQTPARQTPGSPPGTAARSRPPVENP